MDRADALAQGFTELKSPNKLELVKDTPAAGTEVEFTILPLISDQDNVLDEDDAQDIEEEGNLTNPFKGFTVSVTNLAKAEYDKIYFLGPNNKLYAPEEVTFYREIKMTNENKLELAKELMPKALFTKDHLLGLTVYQSKELIPGVVIIPFDYYDPEGELPSKDDDSNSIQVGVDTQGIIVRVL